MNYQSNRLRMMEDPDRPPPQGAFPVWSKVFTNPSEKTFVEITEHPEAQAKAAYSWVFVAGTLVTLIASLLQSVIIRVVSPELGQMPQLPGGAFGLFSASLGILSMLCLSAVSGIFSVAGFALGVALVNVAASSFDGRGTFDKLAYAFGAIAVPATMISAFIGPLSAIPVVMYCTVPLLIGLTIYVLILQATAIKAVHRFGWGQAIISLFLPSILIVLLCGCGVAALVALAGPEILRQMPQSMP